jgi:O-antigen/teichoic acid export membrane protein
MAGTLGTTLLVQLALLITGVASARILGVLDRGNWALLQLLVLVLPIIVLAGLPVSLPYWVARDPAVTRPLLRSLRRVVGWQLVVLVVLHALALLVVFNNAPGYVLPAAAVSLLGSVSIAIWSLSMAVIQGRQRFGLLNLVRVLTPAMTAVLLMAVLATGVGDLFVVTAVSVALLAVAAVVSVVAMRKSLPPKEEAESTEVPPVREVIVFGVKGLLGASSPVETIQLDQAIVGIFLSKAALGIYVVGVAFTNLPRFIALSIGLVAYPRVAAGEDEHSIRRQIFTYAAINLALAGPVVLVLEFLLPYLVPLLFGDPFKPAVEVGQVLLVAALLFGMRRVLAEGARGAGLPGLGSLAEVAAFVSLIPAAALLASEGPKGIAFALLAASVVGLCVIVAGLFLRPPQRKTHVTGQNAGAA